LRATSNDKPVPARRSRSLFRTAGGSTQLQAPPRSRREQAPGQLGNAPLPNSGGQRLSWRLLLAFEVIRQQPDVVADLLRRVLPQLRLPARVTGALGSADMSQVAPAQYLADMVVAETRHFLRRPEPARHLVRPGTRRQDDRRDLRRALARSRTLHIRPADRRSWADRGGPGPIGYVPFASSRPCRPARRATVQRRVAQFGRPRRRSSGVRFLFVNELVGHGTSCGRLEFCYCLDRRGPWTTPSTDLTTSRATQVRTRFPDRRPVRPDAEGND
jgi:hypothetical protein